MKPFPLDPRHWPLAFKAPLLAATFMLVVSGVLTNAVLSRLRETQERHLAAMSTIYLNGLAAALVPHVLRDDIWEVFDTIDRGASLEGGFGRATVIVTDTNGQTIAASDPKRTPVSSRLADREKTFQGESTLIVDAVSARAYARRALVYQDRRIGTIYVDYDVRHLLREREDVLRTLLGTNAAIAILLAAIGYWIIRRMLGPLRTLSRHLDLGVAGAVQPIPVAELQGATYEFRRLFRRFNVMAEALNDREAMARELANEERLASLGRLASGMAHEINNPLGGLFNAIDTIKRHGEKPSVRNASLDLIERGLRGIRDVVRATLATYRADRDPRNLSAADLNDLRFLLEPEIARRALTLDWSNVIERDLPVPASAVRQIALNLLLNALQASPSGARLHFGVLASGDQLNLSVHDQGPGLSPEARAVLDGVGKPISSGEGSGLGLWMTRRLVHDLGGRIAVETSPIGGALVRVIIPLAAVEEMRDVA